MEFSNTFDVFVDGRKEDKETRRGKSKRSIKTPHREYSWEKITWRKIEPQFKTRKRRENRSDIVLEKTLLPSGTSVVVENLSKLRNVKLYRGQFF